MAVKFTKMVKYTTALYHKINAISSTFYMESFMLFSKSAHLLDYAALLKGLFDVKHLPILYVCQKVCMYNLVCKQRWPR